MFCESNATGCYYVYSGSFMLDIVVSDLPLLLLVFHRAALCIILAQPRDCELNLLCLDEALDVFKMYVCTDS